MEVSGQGEAEQVLDAAQEATHHIHGLGPGGNKSAAAAPEGDLPSLALPSLSRFAHDVNMLCLMGLVVLNSMLGPTTPLMSNRLACWGLVSHLIVPLKGICCGILPSSRVA